MPIYEYECQECGKVFEAIQKFSDPELTACRCEKAAPVKKLISAAAFHLKGSGWYVTDFRDKGKKKSADADKGSGDSPSGDDGGGTQTGTEKSKPETTTAKSEPPPAAAAAD